MITEEEILRGMNRTRFDMLCRYDFKFFCERLLGMNEMGGIHDFQLEWVDLAERNRNSVIKSSFWFF